MTAAGPGTGRMTWAQAAAGPLHDTTCVWQDLDGLHVEPPPAEPPPASLLLAWRGTSYLVRVRLDAETAFVAVLDHATTDTSRQPRAARTLPWAPGDERIAASAGRGPSASQGGVGASYEQITIDGIDDGTGPITFIRPARPPVPAGDA